MRISSVKVPGTFKRFGSLEIPSIGADVELVVMLGPNGSGKSSVFDAFLQWGRSKGRRARTNIPPTYFDAGGTAVVNPEITPHVDPSGAALKRPGARLHVRTAHRNTPDVLVKAVQKQDAFDSTPHLDRMVETDSVLSEHYQRLIASFYPLFAKLDSDDLAADIATIRQRLTPVQESLTRVLSHLRFTNLGDPGSEGSFYFTRDGERAFRYENLSGGEKAVFDLLLDVHIAATELGSALICLDEPELHLNPDVQAAVLVELLGLLPANSQLWIATHSVGMIRQAFEIAEESPARVAFLDFGQVSGPAPHVILEPVQPSRRLLQEAFRVALDDLAGLLAPEVLVVCEGAQQSDRVAAWDQHVYRQIFSELHHRVDFVSSGGKGELERAAALAAVIAPGTRLLKLRDCDGLTAQNRQRLLAKDPTLRILERPSLESYLLDDEVLEALVNARGARQSDALNQLKMARDNALRPNGSAKGSLGAVFDTARRVLGNAERIGENRSQFSSDVLAALIHPDMTVAKELAAVLDLDSVS